jgi:hypothetical protein
MQPIIRSGIRRCSAFVEWKLFIALRYAPGNLQIYLSSDRLNTYAEFLHALGPLLWLI